MIFEAIYKEYDDVNFLQRVRVFRFWRRRLWKFLSSGILRRAVLQKVTRHFRGACRNNSSSWWCRQTAPLKRRAPFLPDCTAKHLRSQPSSHSLPWEPDKNHRIRLVHWLNIPEWLRSVLNWGPPVWWSGQHLSWHETNPCTARHSCCFGSHPYGGAHNTSQSHDSIR